MKNRLFRILFAGTLPVALLLSGCGGGDKTPSPTPSPIIKTTEPAETAVDAAETKTEPGFPYTQVPDWNHDRNVLPFTTDLAEPTAFALYSSLRAGDGAAPEYAALKEAMASDDAAQIIAACSKVEETTKSRELRLAAGFFRGRTLAKQKQGAAAVKAILEAAENAVWPEELSTMRYELIDIATKDETLDTCPIIKFCAPHMHDDNKKYKALQERCP